MSREAKSAAIVAACFAILAAVALYFVNEAQTELDAQQATIDGLTSSIEKLEKKVKERPDLQRELEEIENNLNEYIKILPSAQVATPERLQELVQEKLDRASMQISSYQAGEQKQRATARGKKKSRSPFQEISLTLNGSARYDSFVNFLNALERHETFLRVNSFSIRPEGKEDEGVEDPLLSINLNLSTFRYQPTQGGGGDGKAEKKPKKKKG